MTSGRQSAKQRKQKFEEREIRAREEEIRRNLAEFIRNNPEPMVLAYIQEAQTIMRQKLHEIRMQRVWPLGWYLFPQLRQQALERWARAGGALLLQREAEKRAAEAEITRGVATSG